MLAKATKRIEYKIRYIKENSRSEVNSNLRYLIIKEKVYDYCGQGLTPAHIIHFSLIADERTESEQRETRPTGCIASGK